MRISTKSWLKNPKIWLTGFLMAVFGQVVYASSDNPDQSRWGDWNWIGIILFIAVFASLVVAFIWLFTTSASVEEVGGLSADHKIRINLIRFSYCFMFIALAVAIIPFMFQISGDKTGITRRPIALFLGCSKDRNIAKELACEINGRKPVQKRQWVISIGGRIKHCPRSKGEFCVDGGLMVPLYFVVLALIGGAVSLTRRIPEYQRLSSPSYIGTEKEPKLDFGSLRASLIFQIVQFVSAPFIAGVAYYLISPDNRAYSVALGFTAGFASETILVMIGSVVEKIKPAGVPLRRTGATSGIVIDSGTQKGVADAKVTVVGEPGLSKQTDGNGHFVIHEVPVGERVIEASAHNRNALAKVTVEAGKVGECHILLS